MYRQLLLPWLWLPYMAALLADLKAWRIPINYIISVNTLFWMILSLPMLCRTLVLRPYNNRQVPIYTITLIIAIFQVGACVHSYIGTLGPIWNVAKIAFTLDKLWTLMLSTNMACLWHQNKTTHSGCQGISCNMASVIFCIFLFLT